MFALVSIAIFIPILPIVNGNNNIQPCSDASSIELKEPKLKSDGIVIYNGINFPPKYVYSKNVSGEIKTFGCVCEMKSCFRKCCELGFVMYNRSCTPMPDMDAINKNGINLYFTNYLKKTIRLQSSELFLMHDKPCEFMYREIEPWYVQEDGNLYVEVPHNIPPWLLVRPDKYCIDNFVSENSDGTKTSKVDALVCYSEEPDSVNYVLSSTCMLISCVFILATVGVYAWIPKLHNIHGGVLIAYLLSLFAGFLLMATMQLLLRSDAMTGIACINMSFFIYFFLLSAFFWLNVMCFDIWRVFSGKREMRLQKLLVRSQLRAYALYAFGLPTILTVLLISLEFSGLPPHPWLPMLRYQGCFLSGKSKLIYLYGPITVLCVVNMALFVLTALRIAKTKHETSALKSRESNRHDQNDNKQTLILYVKLFVVMGINWILEVVSALYPSTNWAYTDAYNVLIGLIIFIIFVCKPKILQLLKERYKKVKRDPVSQSNTSWSRTTSTKVDEVALKSNSN